VKENVLLCTRYETETAKRHRTLRKVGLRETEEADQETKILARARKSNVAHSQEGGRRRRGTNRRRRRRRRTRRRGTRRRRVFTL
jgi:hypothetical protein